jgi:hypothetical protein
MAGLRGVGDIKMGNALSKLDCKVEELKWKLKGDVRKREVFLLVVLGFKYRNY